MNCIETIGLTHNFGNETALKGINLQVPAASLYGFLGPNGAGKTTALRLILGLLKKQEGDVQVFGKSFDKNRIEILSKTGSLIESPSFYGHLTAHENLKIFQKLYRCSSNRIEQCLEIVGLSHTGRKKTSGFSLGMKQRLGIAIALLASPKLLVLDEPTNGLDPNGIIEMRELLRKLNAEEKITILISSHLLAEIEKLVTHIGIINKGSLLFQGTLENLRQRQVSSITFETNDAGTAAKIIQQKGIVPVTESNTVTIPFTDAGNVAALNRMMVQQGIDVYRIQPVNNDLESIFIELVKSNA